MYRNNTGRPIWPLIAVGILCFVFLSSSANAQVPFFPLSTLGWSGYRGFSIPGFEAQTLVWRNQAMIYGFSGQALQPTYYPYQPQQLQYQLVCRPKSGGRVLTEAGFAALSGGSFGLLVGGGKKGFLAGAGVGGSVGALYALNSYDCYYVPVQVQPQPPSVQQPGQPAPQPPIEIIPRLAVVEFTVVNETQGTLVVEAAGQRAVLGKGAKAVVRTPDIKVFRVQPDGRGSFQEVEIGLTGTEDQTLPGWRIR